MLLRKLNVESIQVVLYLLVIFFMVSFTQVYGGLELKEEYNIPFKSSIITWQLGDHYYLPYYSAGEKVNMFKEIKGDSILYEALKHDMPIFSSNLQYSILSKVSGDSVSKSYKVTIYKEGSQLYDMSFDLDSRGPFSFPQVKISNNGHLAYITETGEFQFYDLEGKMINKTSFVEGGFEALAGIGNFYGSGTQYFVCDVMYNERGAGTGSEGEKSRDYQKIFVFTEDGKLLKTHKLEDNQCFIVFKDFAQNITGYLPFICTARGGATPPTELVYNMMILDLSEFNLREVDLKETGFIRIEEVSGKYCLLEGNNHSYVKVIDLSTGEQVYKSEPEKGAIGGYVIDTEISSDGSHTFLLRSTGAPSEAGILNAEIVGLDAKGKQVINRVIEYKGKWDAFGMPTISFKLSPDGKYLSVMLAGQLSIYEVK